MEAFSTIAIAISPKSVLPIAVNLVREEKGVITVHPGKRSLALRSIDQNTPSSFK